MTKQKDLALLASGKQANLQGSNGRWGPFSQVCPKGPSVPYWTDESQGCVQWLASVLPGEEGSRDTFTDVRLASKQKPVQANSLRDPISKNPSQKRAGEVTQGVGPEFKPQYIWGFASATS
jgi:hypothetical protein